MSTVDASGAALNKCKAPYIFNIFFILDIFAQGAQKYNIQNGTLIPQSRVLNT